MAKRNKTACLTETETGNALLVRQSVVFPNCQVLAYMHNKCFHVFSSKIKTLSPRTSKVRKEGNQQTDMGKKTKTNTPSLTSDLLDFKGRKSVKIYFTEWV